MGKKNTDICYCEVCKHHKATECLNEFLCKCCEKADRIRFEHPVFDEDSELSEEEKERREGQAEQEERDEQQKNLADLFPGWGPLLPG